MNLLFALAQRAAAALGGEFNAEILEVHHRFKRDAPSGTATRLLEIVQQGTADAPILPKHGRNGLSDGLDAARDWCACNPGRRRDG